MKAPAQEVQANFFSLLSLVEQGEQIIIMRDDKPVAEIRAIPESSPRKKRKAGSARGLISFADDAFAPMSEEELNEIYDHPIFPGPKTP